MTKPKKSRPVVTDSKPVLRKRLEALRTVARRKGDHDLARKVNEALIDLDAER